jgi:SAM-dependent methyltransferase
MTENLKKILIIIDCQRLKIDLGTAIAAVSEQQTELFAMDVQTLIFDTSQSRNDISELDLSEFPAGAKIKILKNMNFAGYGQNLKIAFHYAVENNFDAIISSGELQIEPLLLLSLVNSVFEAAADAALGSRFLSNPGFADKQMAFLKRFCNRFQNTVADWMTSSSLSDFFSPCRCYSVAAIKELPFQYNFDDACFDTDMCIQLIESKKKIVEIPLTALFGRNRESGCFLKSVCSFLSYRLNKLALFYNPKYDCLKDSNLIYERKFGFSSSHQFAFDKIQQNSVVMDLGCGPGYMASELSKKQVKTISIDRQIQPQSRLNSWRCVEADIENYDFNDSFEKIDAILLLDIIEHLKSPERFLQKLRWRFSNDNPVVIITTGNIGFFPLRMNLLFGWFHYGKRGILDMDHTRLLTFSSLARLLEGHGYEIVLKKGIPAPFPLAIGNNQFARFLLRLNQFLIVLSKGLFSYQIAVLARFRPTVENLLKNTESTPVKQK